MYHGSNTWKMKCCMVKFQRSRLLLLHKEWDSAGTAGEARMNLPTSYYYGNEHMAKELVGDQREHSLINWLMTLNYRKKISQMRWMTGKMKDKVFNRIYTRNVWSWLQKKFQQRLVIPPLYRDFYTLNIARLLKITGYQEPYLFFWLTKQVP